MEHNRISNKFEQIRESAAASCVSSSPQQTTESVNNPHTGTDLLDVAVDKKETGNTSQIRLSLNSSQLFLLILYKHHKHNDHLQHNHRSELETKSEQLQ